MATVRKATGTKGEWVSLGDAARALGETRQTVLRRAVAGELEAQNIAGRTVVNRASLDRLVARMK